MNYGIVIVNDKSVYGSEEPSKSIATRYRCDSRNAYGNSNSRLHAHRYLYNAAIRPNYVPWRQRWWKYIPFLTSSGFPLPITISSRVSSREILPRSLRDRARSAGFPIFRHLQPPSVKAHHHALRPENNRIEGLF